MLFVWIGLFKPDAGPILPEINQAANDFLQQPYIPIRSVGPLCDGMGRHAGAMMVFEAADRAEAEALVANSPYRDAGLYERHHLFEYRNEVG